MHLTRSCTACTYPPGQAAFLVKKGLPVHLSRKTTRQTDRPELKSTVTSCEYWCGLKWINAHQVIYTAFSRKEEQSGSLGVGG